MSRSLAFGLVLAAVGAMLWLGYLSTTRIPYFPASFLTIPVHCGDARDETVVNEIEDGWFSHAWRAADEESLYVASRKPGAAATRTLRFTWLRTFDHPVFVRIDRPSGGPARLTAKQLSGAGGYDPGDIEKQVVRDLTPEETARLDRMLQTTRVLQAVPKLCDGGLDGSRWLVETSSPEDYRLISRFSPDGGPVREFGLFMLGLTGWTFERTY